MAVVKFGELWQDRELVDGDIDDSSAVRSWRAVTNDKANDRAQTVLNHGINNNLLPERYDAHPDNAFLTCRRLVCKNQSESPFHWIITAEYSSQPLKESDREKEAQEVPDLRPAKYKWSTNKYLKAIDKDRDGDAIVNTAGDYFDPPIEVDLSYWVVTVEKNIAFAPSWLLDMGVTPINSDSTTFAGFTFPEQTLRLVDLQISELQRESIHEFYVLTLMMEYQRDGWAKSILNQGLNQIIAGQRKRCKLADGSPTPGPVLLNAIGQQIAAPSPSVAVYVDYDVHPLFDFNLLPLT